MIKVFRVKLAINEFQYLLPTGPNVYSTDILRFECKPKAVTWSPPQMYSERAVLPEPDLWHPGTSAAMAADPRSFKFVQTVFEMAGELLPLPFEGRELAVLNILECINCLDQERSKWITTKDGRRSSLDTFAQGSYVFHPNRIGESSLFKIPETHKAEMLCVERDSDPDLEFKAAVEAHKLKGVKFTELWCTDT